MCIHVDRDERDNLVEPCTMVTMSSNLKAFLCVRAWVQAVLPGLLVTSPFLPSVRVSTSVSLSQETFLVLCPGSIFHCSLELLTLGNAVGPSWGPGRTFCLFPWDASSRVTNRVLHSPSATTTLQGVSS